MRGERGRDGARDTIELIRRLDRRDAGIRVDRDDVESIAGDAAGLVREPTRDSAARVGVD
jgi:hypothetical protein